MGDFLIEKVFVIKLVRIGYMFSLIVIIGVYVVNDLCLIIFLMFIDDDVCGIVVDEVDFVFWESLVFCGLMKVGCFDGWNILM